MAWTKQKSTALLRQLRDITNCVEILDRGICELEAKQLTFLDAPFITKQMRADANFLTAMNNSTANSIQSSLREIEDIIRNEMEGAEDAKELIKEFVKVLRNAIRVLHDYRLFQQAYVDNLNSRVSISPSPNTRSQNTLGKSKTDARRQQRSSNQGFNPLGQIAKFARYACGCGFLIAPILPQQQ